MVPLFVFSSVFSLAAEINNFFGVRGMVNLLRCKTYRVLTSQPGQDDQQPVAVPKILLVVNIWQNSFFGFKRFLNMLSTYLSKKRGKERKKEGKDMREEPSQIKTMNATEFN